MKSRAKKAKRRKANRRVRSRLRPLGVALLLLGVGGAAASYAAERIPTMLRGMEFFRVQNVEFEGLRFAKAETLRDRMALLPEASVWDDPAPLTERLELDALVARARITRDLPSTIVVHVVESQPVALIATPTLEPIDRRGDILPIDPAQHRLDLPVLRASLEPGSDEFHTSGDLRSLLQEWVHLRDIEPNLAGRVSQVGLDERGAIEVKMFEPDITLRYRPPASLERLEASARVIKDARARRPDIPPIEVDLRFGDRIVVRYADSRGQ